MIAVKSFPSRAEWPSLLARPVQDASALDAAIQPVLREVRTDGDKAVRKYTLRFDKADISTVEVPFADIEAAERAISEPLRKAIQLARANIEKFHAHQRELGCVVETQPGVTCWRKSVAIEKVGLYIPGGTAPLFSTVLMLAVPAKLAGCNEIVLCTPPGPDGKVNPAILYAAHLVGVTKIFRVGGVQAIAAMAYGTESIPKVYKIFGPGNQYVMGAKALIQKEGVAIDLPAGPSEVMVVADATCKPSFVAADLLSQAEHGPDSQTVLVTTSSEIANAVNHEVARQVAKLPRQSICADSLKHSKCLVVRTLSEAQEIVNFYAPEHLIVSVADPEEFSAKVVNAGSVFLGNYAPESVGDYASGTNHTLPTNGYALAYSGVSLDSFLKKITFQKLTPEGLQQIGPAVEIMAANEQLDGHKNAVSLRLAEIESANKRRKTE